MKRLPFLPFYILGACLGLMMLLFAYAMYVSFAPMSPPLKVNATEYRAIKISDGTIVIYYDCNSEVFDDFEAHVHRTATHTETGLIVALPTAMSRFQEGQHKMQRQFYIPSPAPSGEWCVTSIMDWRPSFSISDRSAPARTTCFVVK